MSWLAHRDRIGSLILLVFAGAYLVTAVDLPTDPSDDASFTSATLPVALAGALIVCALIGLLKTYARGAASDGSQASFANWRLVAILVGLMSAYAATFAWLGFGVSSFLFLLVGFRLLGETRWWLSVAVAGGLIGTMWLLLGGVFGLYLDPGELLRGVASLVGGSP